MKKKTIIPVLLLYVMASFGQTFEEPKLSVDDSGKFGVNVGGDFALQYQILNHSADSALIPLGTGFNLPAANFNLNVMLSSGIKLNLVTYLSSRHHNEAWVKGGYLLVDDLSFLNSKKVDKMMEYLTLKIGNMEVNYGDAHFRRSDNGHVTGNPFVGNYIMDAFTTATAMEVMFRSKGLLLMGAVSSGTLRPDLVRFSNNTYSAYDTHKELVFYWKAGFDKQLTEDIRARMTVSGWHQGKHHFGTLYNGDRAGSRYYLIMNRVTNSIADTDIKSNHTSGRWGPGITDKDNSLMINLFGKAKGFELFGTYELASGEYASDNKFRFSQIGIEGIYRFGSHEQFYGGARYNLVSGDTNTPVTGDQSVNRIQFGAGWYILESTVLKLEYVKQNYVDFIADYGDDAGFNGLMIEAAISF
ncbi:MAG: hypothetical protein JW723_04525 [Bacteroidales bacterium]|nr:hypothetical protein [Bacteroidales bacterium]